jgi:O-antigen/teichoic acid export membrane protein
MHNVRRISRQLFAFGTADVMVLVVNFLLLPIYTRVLRPSEYGALALLLVCEAFLKVIFRWGLDTSFMRFYYDYRDEEDRRTLASTIVIFWLVLNGAILFALLAAARPVNRLLFGSLDLLVPYTLLLINTFAGTFLFLPFSQLRIQQRARFFASMTFLRSFGTVVVRLLLVVVWRMGVTGIVLADVVITAVLFVVLGRMLLRAMSWRFSPTLLRSLLGYAFPRVPHGLLTQTMGMSDRFLLGRYLPLSEVGVYQIGSTVASTLKFYSTAFELAWFPFAYDSMRRRDARELFARLATYACVVLAFCAVALAGLGAVLVVLLLPPTFHDASRVVPLLVAGMAIQSLAWFLATSLNVAKRTQPYPLIAAVGAVTSVAANVALIPRVGLMGAALAVVLSQAAATGTTLVFAQRAYHIPYESRLAKLAGVTVAVYAAMMAVPSLNPWQLLAARGGLLVLFPIGLYVARFLQPHETQQIREFLASMLERARTGNVPDLTVGQGPQGRPLGGPGL